MATADVSAPAGEYAARREQWKLARALLGGTSAMRAAGKDHLPRFEAEEEAAWRRRLASTVLHAGFATIVRTMAGLPFSKAIAFGDDIMPELAGQAGEDNVRTGGWAEDIDLKGNHLQVFGKRVFLEALALGSSHILVDMPAGAPRTAAYDLKRRPRWCHYAPEQLLDARRSLVDGRERYVHVRLLERIRTHQGYAESYVDQVREIEPGAWRIWRRSKSGTWAVFGEGEYALPYVTLVPFLTGTERGEFTASAPLDNCAHLNVAHWQSSSDQRNVLTFSRFAMLFVKGSSSAADIKLGPMTVITTDEQFGDAKVLEHSGAAIEAGERDLKNLEAQMEAEGLKMLVRRPGNVTATQMVIDEAKDQSELEALAGEFSDALELAAQYTAAWLGRPEGSGGSIAVSKDFGVVPNAEKIMATVLKLRELGDIAAEDALEELKRAGVLSETLNVADALERAAHDMARVMAAAQTAGPAAEPDDG